MTHDNPLTESIRAQSIGVAITYSPFPHLSPQPKKVRPMKYYVIKHGCYASYDQTGYATRKKAMKAATALAREHTCDFYVYKPVGLVGPKVEERDVDI